MIHDIVHGLDSFVNVDSWIDIVDHIWVGFVLIMVAAVPSIISARNNKGIKRIESQVVNGHTDPLRKDLDRVIDTLSETSLKVDAISVRLNSLHEELLHEESLRRSSVADLRNDFDVRFSDIIKRFMR